MVILLKKNTTTRERSNARIHRQRSHFSAVAWALDSSLGRLFRASPSVTAAFALPASSGRLPSAAGEPRAILRHTRESNGLDTRSLAALNSALEISLGRQFRKGGLSARSGRRAHPREGRAASQQRQGENNRRASSSGGGLARAAASASPYQPRVRPKAAELHARSCAEGRRLGRASGIADARAQADA